MSIPQRIQPASLSDFLEVMSQAVFQTGIRWSTIEQKWPAFKLLFFDFDPERVSKFTGKDIERLSADERILRSPKKIAATVDNARVLLSTDKEYGTFCDYLHAFAGYDALARDLKKRFKYMGDLNTYYFLFRVGEPVPNFESWVKTIPGDHPRMKEMIEGIQVR